MNFIDIASYQGGMNLNSMFQKNPSLGGVIVKVSEGTYYTNPEAKAWLDWLVANGKPAGTYHYLAKNGAEAEARFYVDNVKPWLGNVALAIDYEEGTLAMGTGYLKACLDEVFRLTGVKPMVYCSQIQALESQDFSAIAAAGYPLWVAQYANHNPVRAFIENPWHTGTSAPFPKYTMRQYTDSGYLLGWSKNLDFDLFYGDAADWAALYGGTAPQPTPELTPDPTPAPVTPYKPADPDIVLRTLKNEFGIGTERIMNLREAGYDPDSVQKKINQIYLIAGNVKKDIGNDMSYLNSILWIVRSI